MELIASGKKWGKLYDFGSSTVPKNPPTALNWSETNGVMKISDTKSNREPDTVDYDKDFIIKKYGIRLSRNEFQVQLEKEFEEMIASVEKYGGFYIGRYETGNWHSTKAVVRKGMADISATKNGQEENTDKEAIWYAYYAKSKKLAGANSNVRTSMIWGCQWDRTLTWLVESKSKTMEEIIDSKGWGNYKDSTGNAATGSNAKQPTGYNEAWKANNIYDMAGNVYDFTMEASGSSYRSNVGGSYSVTAASRPVPYRNSVSPSYSGTGLGARAVLYVK